MKDFKKTAILLIMLVLPVLVFAFLKIFGKNEFSGPPVFVPDNLTACATLTPGKHQVPAFSFIGADSLPITDKEMAGKVYVAAFFSIDGCPELCADIASGLYRVQERFANNDAVKMLSHTVNPETDTPAKLLAYSRQFDAKPGKWLFATGGTAQSLKELATCGYAIQAQKPDLQPESMLMLIDQQRRIRGYYDATNREDVDRLLDEIALILRNTAE